ncbi:MAG TPA: hypothetical protein VGV35_08850 [Bryobacteraceae bacterium]|nr:hypothetical protein [Bryobacteraceae bacterium]
MTRFPVAGLAAALLCGSLLAQSPQSAGSGNMSPQSSAQPTSPTASPSPTTAPTAASAKTSRIAPGSVIPVQLTKSVDAKKAKKGDEVVAKVMQDLQSNGGAVVVPKDTKIVGHVTEAEAHSKEQKESQLAIAFDHAVLKNGEQMEMPMSIQAIIAPPNRNPGAQQASSYPSPAGGGAPASGGGARTGGMGGSAPQAQSAPQTTGTPPSEAPTGAPAQPQITGNTQGVVGISNLKLSAAPDATQGSLVTSEKNNVKLEDGTFLLLRVNQ